MHRKIRFLLSVNTLFSQETMTSVNTLIMLRKETVNVITQKMS